MFRHSISSVLRSAAGLILAPFLTPLQCWRRRKVQWTWKLCSVGRVTNALDIALSENLLEPPSQYEEDVEVRAALVQVPILPDLKTWCANNLIHRQARITGLQCYGSN